MWLSMWNEINILVVYNNRVFYRFSLCLIKCMGIRCTCVDRVK